MLRVARKHGQSDEWMHLLNAWHEAPIYSARERAALSWTEAVTKISEHHVPDEVYDEARKHFSEKELVDLTARGDRNQCLESRRDRVSSHAATAERETRRLIDQAVLYSDRGNGAAERIRTSDPRITNALLYRLSYRGACACSVPELRADCHREQGKEFLCRRRFREPRIGLLVDLHRGGVAAADDDADAAAGVRDVGAR